MAEEFRVFAKDVEVSNLGNVRRNGKLLEKHKGEYYYYVLYGKKNVRVHTMVGKCFPEICGEFHKGWVFHHINRDQTDNRAENIICLSPNEHKRIHQKEDGVSVAVKAYDLNGKFVGRWDTKTQAAEETNIDYRHISDIILGKGRRFTAGKMYWFREEETEEKVAEYINTCKTEKYKRNRKSIKK